MTVVGADVAAEPPDDGICDAYSAFDIGDADSVDELVARSRPDWVFNLAGRARGASEDVFRVNTLGAAHLLESIRKRAPEARVCMVGSAAEYGPVDESELPITEQQPCRPIGDYGISKYAATTLALGYVRAYGLSLVVARPFNIVGPGIGSDLVVGAILRRAREALADQAEPVVAVGNLETMRDFVAVEDAMAGLVGMVRSGHSGEVFNICSGEARSVREVVELALSHSTRPIRLEVDPDLVRPQDVRVVFGSWRKANLAFGFRPTTGIEASLEAAWRYANR